MYVRPYLEDPIFLQPDDDEVSRLHALTDPEAAKKSEQKPHVEVHDLPGDPDLENPSEADSDDDSEPAWITEHRNILERTAAMTSNESKNPNGFRAQGEPCSHNFECVSGKCMSWLNKAPTCMPF